MRYSDDIESDPHVDPLLLSCEKGMSRAIGKPDEPVAISQGTREDMDFVPAHHAELAGPELVPPRIVRGIGDAGVEAHLAELPALALADPACQGQHVVVGIGIPKGFTGSVEEILAVNERYGFLSGWLRRHYSPLK